MSLSMTEVKEGLGVSIGVEPSKSCFLEMVATCSTLGGIREGIGWTQHFNQIILLRPALSRIFMALQHELGPPVLITCGRSKEAATPADLVVVDTLDTMVLKGTRAEMLCWFPQCEISRV